MIIQKMNRLGLSKPHDFDPMLFAGYRKNRDNTVSVMVHDKNYYLTLTEQDIETLQRMVVAAKEALQKGLNALEEATEE